MLQGERRTLRAVAHPLRLRLLSLLSGEQLSASEIARRLGERPANVSFHLRKLEQAGLVEVVGTTQVRGGTAKIYRHNPASGEQLRTSADFRLLAQGMGQELARRAHGIAAEEPPVFTDFEGWVDPATAERVARLAREIGALLHDAAGPHGHGRVRLATSVAVFRLAETEQ
ncbi:ArsR/SmtB family transcription factor [Dactylosporangium sucinum]|nr:helix-turn-helix domain-containing protein [Dactylosporangium sucinum]